MSNGGHRTFNNLLPGSYDVSEEANSNYTTTAICDNQDNPSQITLAAGQDITCTFTNTLKQGGLTVVKNAVGGDDSFSFHPSWTEDFSIQTEKGTGSQHFDLDATSTPYSISENTPPSGWEKDGVVCENNSQQSVDPANIIITPDGGVTCTFTNTKHGQLIVHKDTSNEDSQTNFTITASGTGTIVSPSAEQSITGGSQVTYEVTPGVYSVNEAVKNGWTLSSNTCAEVSVVAGGTSECTITNTYSPTLPGTLIVKKVVSGSQASPTEFSFSVNGGQAQAFEADGQNDITVNPGVYTVVETEASGYNTTYDNCSEVNVPEDGSATCTITNTYVPS